MFKSARGRLEALLGELDELRRANSHINAVAHRKIQEKLFPKSIPN